MALFVGQDGGDGQRGAESGGLRLRERRDVGLEGLECRRRARVGVVVVVVEKSVAVMMQQVVRAAAGPHGAKVLADDRGAGLRFYHRCPDNFRARPACRN